MAGPAGAAAATGAAGANDVVRVAPLRDLGTHVPPPRIVNGTGKSGDAKWHQITVQYDSFPRWIDELVFRYSVLLSSVSREGKREFMVLHGDVTYIDVEEGHRHTATAFVRPTALLRYGEVAGVAVEILLKGETLTGVLQEEQRLQRPVEWWKSKDLPTRDGYIVPRSQTPFALVPNDDEETNR